MIWFVLSVLIGVILFVKIRTLQHELQDAEGFIESVRANASELIKLEREDRNKAVADIQGTLWKVAMRDEIRANYTDNGELAKLFSRFVGRDEFATWADNARRDIEGVLLEAQERINEWSVAVDRKVTSLAEDVADIQAEEESLLLADEVIESEHEAAELLQRENLELRAERDKDHAEIEQLRVQLAGCGVAAFGCADQNGRLQQGDYGWSQSFEDVRSLRKQYDAVYQTLKTTPFAVKVEDIIAEPETAILKALQALIADWREGKRVITLAGGQGTAWAHGCLRFSLAEDEVIFLYDLLGKVGGDARNTRRKISDDLYHRLRVLVPHHVRESYCQDFQFSEHGLQMKPKPGRKGWK